jgi:hypothetical protein
LKIVFVFLIFGMLGWAGFEFYSARYAKGTELVSVALMAISGWLEGSAPKQKDSWLRIGVVGLLVVAAATLISALVISFSR